METSNTKFILKEIFKYASMISILCLFVMFVFDLMTRNKTGDAKEFFKILEAIFISSSTVFIGFILAIKFSEKKDN